MRHVATICLIFPLVVSASSGDRSEVFQACISRCEGDICNSTSSLALPLTLRLTRWTCQDNCKYTCMHAITDHAIRTREDHVHQYYGKWPFWRFAGMQEPASVLFSLFNFWAHVQGLTSARRCIPKGHPMRCYYLAWGLVNLNAWIWSAVFHTRDTPTTEKLDYFSAALAILYSLFYTVVRLFHLYRPPAYHHRLIIPSSPRKLRPLLVAWGALCIMLYVLHVSYLTLLPRFDYTYNMISSVAVGILHNLLWVSYSIPSSPIRAFPLRPQTYLPNHAYKAVLFAVLTTMATCLEVFDFPPWWRVIDAHSLWHLSTVPIVFFWWEFLIRDALDEGWRAGKA